MSFPDNFLTPYHPHLYCRSMMIYTKRYVSSAMRAIAAENPDRVNPILASGIGCAYNGADGSHCIAGQFLANEGITIRPEFEDSPITVVCNILKEEGKLEIDSDAVKVLAYYQAQADCRRCCWGDLLRPVVRKDVCS